MRFVKSVVDYIVTDKDFYSVLKDLFFSFEIIDVFTDVDLSEINDSVDAISSVDDFVNNSNIVEIVKANARAGLIEELEEAVDFDISYRTGIHVNSITTALTKLINTVNSQVKDLDMATMVDFAESVNGISENLTADSIVKAYINSGLYKKNHSEIDDNRSGNIDVENVSKNDTKDENNGQELKNSYNEDKTNVVPFDKK